MSFRLIVEEINERFGQSGEDPTKPSVREVLSMVVPEINLAELVAVAQRKPRKPRADKGKAREAGALPGMEGAQP